MNMAAALERHNEAMDLYIEHQKSGGLGSYNDCGQRGRWNPSRTFECPQKQKGELALLENGLVNRISVDNIIVAPLSVFHWNVV